MATIKSTKKSARDSATVTGKVDKGKLPETLIVTVSGHPDHVRRTLTAMRFEAEEEWNIEVARQIALDETDTEGAELDDELGGPKIQMFADDDRNLYRDRCVKGAKDKGHPVSNPSKIPNKKTTTVVEVGDALFANVRP